MNHNLLKSLTDLQNLLRGKETNDRLHYCYHVSLVEFSWTKTVHRKVSIAT